jgi:hypothetical protein
MARFVVPVAAPRPYAAGRRVFVSGRGLDQGPASIACTATYQTIKPTYA